MIPFVIVSYPRTGSTFFSKVLNSSQKVTCHSEIFHSKFDPFSRSFYDESESSHICNLLGKRIVSQEKLFKFRNRFPVLFYKKIFTSEANKHIGFKIFPGQNHKAYKSIIRNQDVQKIFLSRDDLAENYLSRMVAKHNVSWESVKRNEVEKVFIDIDALKKHIVKHETIFSKEKEYLKTKQNHFLDYTYEQIVNKFPSDEISSFLGSDLSDLSLDVGEFKQANNDMSHRILNSDEVIEFINKYKSQNE